MKGRYWGSKKGLVSFDFKKLKRGWRGKRGLGGGWKGGKG